RLLELKNRGQAHAADRPHHAVPPCSKARYAMKIINSLIPIVTHAAVVSVAAILAFTAITTGDVFAQGKTLVGSWTLDPAKSHFDPGPTPYKSMTLNFS